MSLRPDVNERDLAFFTRPETIPTLTRIDKEEFPRLFGAPVYYGPSGDIFYVTYRYLPKEGFIPDDYVQVSRDHPHATIFSDTSTIGLREVRINRVQSDGGSVEAAIRSVDHVLTGERKRERGQSLAIAGTALGLLDIFQTDFGAITPEEFEAAREKTYNMLARVKLNPGRVLEREKKRIAHWIIKGSFGQDSLGRRNKLISVMALSAAYRHAMERYKGIGTIVNKFAGIREALIFEREFGRAILSDVRDRLRPSSLPSHMLFKYPAAPAVNEGIVTGMLNTMRFQLDQPHVKPYKTAASEAHSYIGEILELLARNDRAEVVRKNLFGQARDVLGMTLDQNRDIYKSGAKGELPDQDSTTPMQS